MRAAQGDLQIIECTRPALGPRLFHEALVVLPVITVLRVEFVSLAVFLQRLLRVVLVLKGESKAVMGAGVVRVEAERLAFFSNLSVPILFNSERGAKHKVCQFVVGV